MAAKVFISQAAVDAWVSSGGADFRGQYLVLRAGDVTLCLAPASLFMNVSGGGEDPNRLVGKVKAPEALSALGAELYMSSVLLGETAYDVEPGFLATPTGGVDGAGLIAALRAVGS